MGRRLITCVPHAGMECHAGTQLQHHHCGFGGALDVPGVSCMLGVHAMLQVRVFHDSSGPSPAWFLSEVRVRRPGACWTVFPCGRWLAVDQDDGWALAGLVSPRLG